MSTVRPGKRYLTTGDPLSGRWRRRAIAWFGLVLLAFNILAGEILPAAAADSASSTPLSQLLSGDRIVVCTAGGLVVLDHDGHPIGNDPAGGHNSVCVYCLPLMQGVASVSAFQVADLPPAPPVVGTAWYATSTPIMPARPTGSVSSRGPPGI